MTLCGAPRDPSRLSISAGALILTTLLLRNLCPTNRMRPSWHGSGQFLGGASVLSSFGTRETKTADADEPELHAGVAARRRAGGWAALSRGTFSGSIFLTDV